MPSLARSLYSLAFSATVALAALPACGDDDGGDDDVSVDGGGGADAGPDASTGPSLGDICDEDGLFIDLFSKFLECNPEFLVFANGVSDAELSAACYGGIGAYVNDGTTTLGPASALSACAAYIASATCDDLDLESPGPCDGVFVGTIAANGSCESDEQCAGDSYCDQSGGTTCGACKARKTNGMACNDANECVGRRCTQGGQCADQVALNGACVSDDECIGGLVCPAGTCVSSAPPAQGAACDIGMNFENFINACRPALTGRYCKPNNAMTTIGTCQPFAAVGATCANLGVVNANNWCNLTAYETCSMGTNQCQAATIVNQGQACGLVQGLKCAEGLMCGDHDDDSMSPDECFTPLQEGATCDPQNNLCDVFLECDDTTLKCRYEYTGTCPAP